MDSERWFALQVHSRREALIAGQLRAKGYEEFLPLYCERRTQGRRTREVSLPLFPSYVFCRFSLSQRTLPILTTPGVIRIVGMGATPTPLDDSEISAVQKAVAYGRVQPHSTFVTGQQVELTEGPLAGCEGVVVRVKNSWRLIISVSLLQRSVDVEIDHSWARPIQSVVRRPAGFEACVIGARIAAC